MKKYIVKSAFIIAIVLGVFSCKKNEVPLFDTPAGVHFMDTLWSFSFIDTPGETEKVVKLSARVFGKSASYDRKFRVEVLTDDEKRVTTLPSENYEILDCFVPADSSLCIVPIKVKYAKEMDKDVYKLYLRIVSNDEFPNCEFNSKIMLFEVTNKLIKPANWNNALQGYFGVYSTAWYKFILKVAKMSSIPYYPGHADKETYWMGDQEFMAYAEYVKYELQKYNDLHPGDELEHDDGETPRAKVKMNM